MSLNNKILKKFEKIPCQLRKNNLNQTHIFYVLKASNIVIHKTRLIKFVDALNLSNKII